jgi:hypothetical protein
MNKHEYTFGFIAARNGKPYCNTCTLPFEDEIHGGEDMADIDATDNHMGRTAEGTYPVKRHMFVGPTKQGSCHNCGSLRIHDNHRGFDYDTEKHLYTSHRTPTGQEVCATCGGSVHDVQHTSTVPTGVKPETIAEEASRIVYGDREQAYDDPNVNFEKIAHMWNGLFLRKLKPDARITPEDVALAFVLLKVSRESHKPSRDNKVDIIGYTLCLQRVVESKSSE